MAIGPGDLTPGWMNVVASEKFKHQRPLLTQGTRARQFALMVAYESALLCLSDTPSHYREAPEALWFLKSVPTVWEETRVPLGEIGQYVVVLRRSGKDWWLAALSDEKARTLKLPLTFLKEGEYEIHSVGDCPESAEDPKRMQESARSVTAQDTFDIPLAPGGGMVARFSRK
jgi:alpha-glucosidase